tara:strand:- start:7664 stop:8704 length:1041 start_codon:yes stop_codon:yes gene_type:complete
MNYSPNTHNWQTVGHNQTVSYLAEHVLSKNIVSGYLFSGPPSIGKSTLAINFAQAMSCKKYASSPCLSCRSCGLISKFKHPDLHLVSPHVKESGTPNRITVDAIRSLVYKLTLSPIELERHIVIVENIESATKQACDALLKSLEEPPGRTVFLMTTNNILSVPNTIISRSLTFDMKPLSVSLATQTLIKMFSLPKEEASLFAHISNGRLGWAIQLIKNEEVFDRRKSSLDQIIEMLHSSRVDRFIFAEKVSKNKVLLSNTLNIWCGFWRDIMLVSYGASESAKTNIDYALDIERLALEVSSLQAHNALACIRKTQEYLNTNANPRLVLENLMLELPLIETKNHLDK